MTYAASASSQRVRAAAEGGLPAVALGLAVAPVLATNGGFFPSSWGWAGMALAWAAVLAAAFSNVSRPTRLELLFVGALTAFAGYTAASIAWSSTQSETSLELNRMLVYVAGVLAAVTIVGGEHVRRLLGGVCAGTTVICAYALATRLFPQGSSFGAGFHNSRLATPVGYWNGLGLVAGMATLLAFVFAVRADHMAYRALAAASLPLLLATLYFTYSRGAWVSFFAGVVVLFAVDRRRLELVGVGAAALLLGGFGIWRASHSSALTHTSVASFDAAVHQGHSLAVVLVVVCLLMAYASFVAHRVDRLWHSRGFALGARIALVAAVLVVVVAVLARYGSPVNEIRHAYHSFVAQPTHSQTDLNKRLFSLSNNGRLPAWKVAWRAFSHHPIGGIGAGGFETYWYQHRAFPGQIKDAHNLYLEILAEGGAIGMALLGLALLTPLLAARRIRDDAIVVGAFAAYVAYLVEAVWDWDWELSGVTLAALFCGAAVLLAGRNRERQIGSLRWPVLALGAVVALIAMAGLAGRLALSASANALTGNDWAKAESDARHARTLMPWSAEPWAALGRAEHGAGDPVSAVKSYREAIAKSPGDYRVWVELARVETGQRRILDFAQAIKLNPAGADDIRVVAQALLQHSNGGS
jgi:hypothetical protein